ncbi:MAG TPA: Sec-independent protein translocase protein TatB [Sulfurovum sp.]|jgi:sec-independent protein translocase protein TatB|nr:MAG: twin arginine-targeting protein translocase TatB [Sulfurovum sp. 35-42-20]OYY56051.1 MAG: twin arginine-targeting protein translocase TatB [Sulfurovum sp. 28-43-6]OYZ25334.1 MAG: twin arginine-targeting protein translocase TatB [Sulfurovum sp. 16-42-52]OYZ49084.1 MAG: twin arginine-targeting protein translocase TatB [Sulfurovum sp. 24-42-9]OZA46851.1 MAG: twin arginine-targeting protein translocase TatB [Sulfurovum sp. 17-42-90]OZA59194.1 MAG: twin arginine-targeting protein translocas
MFGIGFTELLLIAIIAILFLGPDKLPTALVDMAKFIKSVKKTIGEAKSSLEEEMKIAELKEEALSYKKQLDEATNELKNFKNIDFDSFANTTYETDISKDAPQLTEPLTTQIEPENDTVTFKKKDKADASKGEA